jgi:hypothetical protein
MSVELRVSADELSHAMDNMRMWLDDNKISATSFRYDRVADGTFIVVLTFADAIAANAFANAFNGKLLP